MSKKKEWTVQVGEESFNVKFERNIWSGKHKIFINNNVIIFNQTFIQKLAGVGDQAIMIGDKLAHVVVTGNKVDLAIDGYFVDSNKVYTPSKLMPWWVWIFIIACFAIPIYSLGGAIPALIGVLGAMLCARLGMMSNQTSISKVLACTGVTIIAWGIFFLNLMIFSPYNEYAGKYNLTSIQGIPGVTASSYEYNYIELDQFGNYNIKNKINNIETSQSGTYEVEDKTIYFITKSGSTKVKDQGTIDDGQITLVIQSGDISITMVLTKEE